MGILTVGLTLQMPTFLTPMSGMVARSFRRIVSLVGGGRALTERIPGQSTWREKPKSRLMSDACLKVCPATVELAATVPATVADGAGLDRYFDTAVN